MPRPGTAFADLIAEAAAASVDGWDFSWLDGRATEDRPPWGYQRLMAARLQRASASLDLDTGGGEVLAGAGEIGAFPRTAAATEAWAPNAVRATELLHPRGVTVVQTTGTPPLPFAAEGFDLVTSRHPPEIWWSEIARVLRPGGTYLAQHIGPANLVGLTEFFCGATPDKGAERRPDAERAAAEAAGLQVIDVRSDRLRVAFFDVGAVVYFLRKVIWTVPGFSVERYLDRLADMHRKISDDGVFVDHCTRTLFEARKPR